MKKQKMIFYEEALKMGFFPSSHNEQKTVYHGGLEQVLYLNELCITAFDSEEEEDKKLVRIYGSRRALKELGKYLVNLSNFETEDANYHDHFDHYEGVKGNVELIIHHSNYYEDRKKFIE